MDPLDTFFGMGDFDDETPDEEKLRRQEIEEKHGASRDKAAALQAMDRLYDMCLSGQARIPVRRIEMEIIGDDTLRCAFWGDEAEYVAGACFPLSRSDVAVDFVSDVWDHEHLRRG